MTERVSTTVPAGLGLPNNIDQGNRPGPRLARFLTNTSTRGT
jgi:hypothetical protein